MFRRARLSVKPNVRPGVGTRGSAAPNPQRGPEAPRPPEPAAESAPKPADPTDVSAVDSGAAEPQKKAPGRSDEKTGDEDTVEESSKSPSTVSQRRKRVSSTPSLAKPTVSASSQSHPLSTVNHDAPQPSPTPAKEKQPCSDRYRIYKARKLRQMLKEELRKEKKQWKNKFVTNESQRPPDRSKMTMRDFIYYLPDNNPMTSSVEQEKKTEKSLAPTPAREQENQSTHDADDNEEVEEEADDGPLLVPRVKVAEDGSIILDEESLTVEVLRTKGPCVVEENDPIFERGSTTTYSSFRKNYYSKPWSNKETDMFFLAISMVGTDFSMIGQLFPHRARIEIKNKFKREEKANGWRIDKAFQEKRPFDFDFFAHLLQKVLAEEEKRKQKSTKCQSLKEKASKPRKNIKAKKVTSEEVTDDPDESVSTNISDPERSQKDAPTADEEQSPSSSGQHLGQVMLEQEQNHEKRRSQDEANNKQETTNLLGNVLVHSSPPESEIHKNTCPSEENESECNVESIPSFSQNTDDGTGLASSEKAETRTEPISSPCKLQDIMSLASESSESSVADFPVSGAGKAASCEGESAESTCTEGRSPDLKNKSPETEQAENVKPESRSRLQRPKPNLSRAVGKKSVVSQDKQDERSKNSSSETSAEKNHMEKERVNVSENFGAEITERENPNAEAVSDLSEKSCVQEDSQPKNLRPARLMRSRIQRPRPNVERSAERKEILTLQEKTEAHVEKSKDESCVDREKNESCVAIAQQMEKESHNNLQCEDTLSQPEQKNTSEDVQSDESRAVNECPSIQEGNKVNKVKKPPVLRIRFQKPKPNTGRKRGSSKEGIAEEIPVSVEGISTLEEIARLDTSPREKAPNVAVATLIATPSTKELESDLKDSRRNDSSSNMKMSEMTDVTMEMEIGLETIGRDTSPKEMGAEMFDTPMETETGVKASLNEISPMEKKVPELIDTTREICVNLRETGRKEIFLQENDPKEVSPVSEMKTGLEETAKELPTKERISDIANSTEEKEEYSEETERQTSPLIKDAEEAKAMDEMETHLKEMGAETSRREKAGVAAAEQWESEVHTCDRVSRGEVEVGESPVEEKNLALQDTGELDVSLIVVASRETAAIEEANKDLKETEKEISVSWERGAREICIGEEMVANMEKTENIEVSPREHEGEKHTSRQPKTDVIQSRNDGSSTGPSLDGKNISSKLSVMPPFVEEQENAEKEVSSHLCHVESSSQNSTLQEADQGIQLPDVQEQFPDTNLSKPLPQEQKPLEVKPATFLRSRFKKPKPNLSRAALKRATTEAEHCVLGKKSEADKMETSLEQQDSEQADSLSSQHNVPSLMASREKDKPGHEAEEAVTPLWVQTEKDPSPTNSCEPKEDSQLAQNQEDVLIGTQKMNVLTQETKQSVAQTTLPVRGRLQRPRPNVQKARQRQILEKDEAGGVTKNEATELQKDESKTSLMMANSHIESEVEMSSRISESRVNKSQGHVVSVENSSINKTSVSDEQIRHENKPYLPNPAPPIRRRFQKAKPNLEGTHRKKEQLGVEKGMTDQSIATKPEDTMPQEGGFGIQLSLKEKTEILMPMEASVREDCVGPEELGSARKDAQQKAGPLGGAGDESVEDHPASSLGLEEQGPRKQTSSPQLLKESNYSKTSPHRRTTVSSASECETDHIGKRTHRKMKPNVTRGRGSKRIRGKTAKKEPRASKSMLVTLRASQKEDEDDAEDFDSDYEEETCHLAPEELNKAPVFVPVGLRSPEPVSAQIEETMEELEITMDVADVGCVTVEHQLSNMDAATQDVHPEKDLHPSSFEMVIGEQTQEEPGPSDGSTEAAITLLTMGDIVLQSEVVTEQGDVGVCVFPDVHSKDKSHVPFSPDNVNHKIVHEYQEVSSPVISMSPTSFEENKKVSEEQSNREEAAMMEEVEATLSARNTTSTMSTYLRMENKFVTPVTPKPNSEAILDISELGGHQEEIASFCIAKGAEVEIQRETEENDSKVVELEDESLEPVSAAEAKEQNQSLCVHDVEGNSGSQEAILSARNGGHEEDLQEVQLSDAAVASSETGFPTLDSDKSLGESPAEEPLKEDSKGSSMLMLPGPESVPSPIPEVQQENMTNPPNVAVNLFADLQQDGEDEQEFILTLVEIPTNASEGFIDGSMQLMPSSMLPAPILVRSGNAVERSDLSGSSQAASVVEEATCISPSGNGAPQKLPANLDLKSRKRFRCSPDESIHFPPAKKSSITPVVDRQECASEVCSKELNVFEKTEEESCIGQGIFPTSENTHTTSKPQKEHKESTLQNTGSSGSLEEIKDACIEKTMTQLPQDEMVSDKEEKTDPASSSEKRDSMTSSSKPPLTRPGRRPLGFLSLICPKNSLESDEVTQTHSKKRLKPQIPVSRRNLKKSNILNASQKKIPESSDPLPSPSVTDTQPDNTGNSPAQVSCDQPLQTENGEDGPKRAPEEEATTVSELVFSDIFIEVDEAE
ncbi:transcription factor TFIIIB component B'' homolog isoform X2 [Meriones unguiculatus]|uniref:transcription factor TFIIIB component B'' homolog isoform X2 n=1 Tax=Meriones unguiculatus TaxID=10047 RepID=UPI000B4FCB60|nr:transcription factor TFIIIB component B'' homolog isoform X2 [Meriones unguiculatus]